MSEPVKVTVADPSTGEVLDECIIDNDYVVVCSGSMYLDHIATHGNGTAVITVKRRSGDE